MEGMGWELDSESVNYGKRCYIGEFEKIIMILDANPEFTAKEIRIIFDKFLVRMRKDASS